MFKLAIEYFGLTFLANMGVFQLAAVHNKLNGLSLFKKPYLNLIFSFFTIIGPLFFFFIWNDINEIGVIEGAQQAYLFFGSFLLALGLTLGVSSSVHRKVFSSGGQGQTGLNVLRTSPYFKSANNISDKKK